MSHGLVATVGGRLRRGLMHVLMRAHLRPWERHRVAEVAALDLRPERRGVGRAGLHGHVRDLRLEIDVRLDDARQALDRRGEVIVAAGAEDLAERDHERLGSRPVRGRLRAGRRVLVNGWLRYRPAFGTARAGAAANAK